MQQAVIVVVIVVYLVQVWTVAPKIEQAIKSFIETRHMFVLPLN